MLLCFIVILFICVVVGVIKYSTAHSLKQEKDIKLSTIDNEKFTMEKYYTAVSYTHLTLPTNREV